VSQTQAETVQSGAPLEWVGVFGDHPPDEVAACADRLQLAAVQLHGRESAEAVAQIRAQVSRTCEVWKAIPVKQRIPSRREFGADRLLLDGPTAGRPDGQEDGSAAGRLGGWGARFDWRLLTQYDERAEVVLAGGLRAENVAAAAALDTFALDVSSGVESRPGEKDPARLTGFFRERRRLPGRGDS
jgi:indole-3-glycerol phosphate synthase/phosphoribosylanthranilate isomerase